ncbi:uncharacterized protein LOC106173299 [Lingula anatina]|uniref:Uncharacterized protein LOC106173299 n=1 Tax=Lingula anatina TaxID=7574 RepID=A0A1S3JHK3_LINAN|nr:uncharacterized protein LOC106173299 [Lingula anatina]|eukprot:XP_013409838.1 uncharacterized protein LOC106173299 [Lingula anatina]
MDTEEVACNATGAGVGKQKIALPIISVKVRGQVQTKFVETYALLDSGSTQSFCSEELTRSLNLESTRKIHNIVLNTLGHQKRVFSKSVNLEVTNADETLIYDMTDILTRPKLNIGTDKIVTQEELDNWQHLKDIKLPDVEIDQVHILIGQDMPELLKPREIREGKTGMPYAVRTALGWTINGPIGERSRENVSSYFVNTSNEPQDQIKNLCQLDGHDEDFSAMSVNDKKVMTIWENSLHFDEEEKHYSMDIPFQEQPLNLPDNQSVANFHLQCLKRRLQKDKWLKEKYVESMVELRDKGYAEEVKEACRDDGHVWYLANHPVLHARKPDKSKLEHNMESSRDQ